MLIRLARQSEIAPGKLLEKESHGRKLLIVSHPHNGSISVMDAHCFHMGTPLIGGFIDIEDIDGHACVVCPAHRYRIDSQTGHQIDTDLCGNRCSSSDQKQRIYNTHCDGDYIWVDIPDINHKKLPSDYYNQPSFTETTPSRQQYGLLGPTPVSPPRSPTARNTDTEIPPVSPLQPYAGVNTYPIVPGQPSPTKLLDQQPQYNVVADDPPLILSQEDDTAMMTDQQQQQFNTSTAPQNTINTTITQGRIQFPSMKADAPHIARRKAATAAILARSYKPPTSDAPPSPMMVSPTKPVISSSSNNNSSAGGDYVPRGRGLMSSGVVTNNNNNNTSTTTMAKVQQQDQQQSVLPVQRTLFESWGMAPGSRSMQATADSMDMS